MDPISQLTLFAQNYLRKQPFDILHDLEHHQLVHNNVFNIIGAENITANKEVLDVASWWHDVEKSHKTANSADSTVAFFEQTAKDLNINSKFIDNCIAVIQQHSFTQQQTFLESKILFDADKIEYVNVDRIAKLIKDIEIHPEKYTAEQLQKLLSLWHERIAILEPRMFFEYSRQQLKAALPSASNELAKLKTVLEKFD